MMFPFKDAVAALGYQLKNGAEWFNKSIDPRQVAICTIHGNSPHYSGDFARQYAWPELQIQQLRKHTPEGFRVFAYGNNLLPEHESFLANCDEVSFISSAEIKNGTFEHVWPLRNWLARKAMKDYRWIIHLDSDAFPVHDNWLTGTLAHMSYHQPVVAVKRVENGDSHSDRCFLAHSRAAFRRHAFDFSKVGVEDSGGGISKYLEENGFDWHAMLRTNKHDYHPLIAGIYDDLIYHHAAGSRKPQFRQNSALWNQEYSWLYERATHRVLMKRLFEHTDGFLAELRGLKAPLNLGVAVETEIKEI